ncbi:MAG TPA: flagellar biosynthetic protein FliR [Bryobacteraceae bacterium]|nr:flagellar biosynthetic protein FliR [Bryobacteraceae bacterium]
MPVNVSLSLGTLYGFALVLARISGALVFVPMPGMKSVADPARAAFALGFSVALMPLWPVVPPPYGAARLAGWAVGEAAVGMSIGVAVALVMEGFTLGAQILGLQAGYAFASTIDPNTEADSGVLLVFAQLVSGMLFFALGLDREVLRLFAESLVKAPPGVYHLGPEAGLAMIRLGSSMFSVGARLALPLVALLVMVDVALALLGRINSQLQLLSLAFPAKMLTGLMVLSWLAVLFPRLMLQSAGLGWATARRVLGL